MAGVLIPKISCFTVSALAALTMLAPATVATIPQDGNAKKYQPPQGSLTALGKIAGLVTQARAVDKAQFGKHGATFIGTLPGGELYFEVPTIDVDDDGDTEGSPAAWASHPVRGGKIDVFRQEQTSYGGQLPTRHGHTDAISPFEVPYIVLPGGKAKPSWYAQRGIAVGDGAMVIRGGQCVEAVFADVGDVDVGPAVVVKVGDGHASAPAIVGDTGLGGDVSEGAVVIVAEERGVGWGGFAGERVDRGTVDNIDGEPAGVVVVDEADAGAFGFDDVALVGGSHLVGPVGEACFFADVFEDDRAGFDEAACGDGPVLRVEQGGVGFAGGLAA